MTTERKAEIQRKLGMRSLPKPPAGLGDRIKRDIPNPLYASLEKERGRLSRSMAFNLRVAASILILVTSAIFVLHVFTRAADEERASMVVAKRNARHDEKPALSERRRRESNGVAEAPVPAGTLVAPASIPRPAAVAAPARPSILAQEATPVFQTRSVAGKKETRMAEAQPAAALARPVALADAVAEPPQQRVSEDRALRRETPAVAGAVVGGVVSESLSVTAPAVAATATAAPSAPSTLRARQSAELVKSNQSLDRAAGLSDANDRTEAKREVFGTSVDPRAFERIKGAIERGSRPDLGAVDVEALVNYFAGSAPPKRSDVSLEIEASPAPVPEPDDTWLLRYTIDTAATAVAEGASVPPVATNARLEVDFNEAVVDVNPRDDRARSAAEATLLGNTAVTVLHEVSLKDNALPRHRVATVRLTYFSLATGKPKTLEKTLRVSDFRRSWLAASRRHRLATLGAQWGETLKGGSAGQDLARRAAELSKQKPADSRAKDLATLAGATSRGGS